MTTGTSEISVAGGEHVVVFYDRDPDLASSVAAFVAEGLGCGGVAIVAVTAAHRPAFERALAAAGVEPTQAGSVVWLDAAAVIGLLMPSGRIDADAFDRVIAAVVREAAANGRSVRVFGEMVSLLWDAGNVDAALELERLGNELVVNCQCSILCGYRSSLQGHEPAGAMRQVCRLHSSVLSAAGAGLRRRPDGRVLHDEVAAEFRADRGAPRRARRFLVDAMRRWGCDGPLADDAQLVVSELATNAVVHAGSPFSVVVSRSGPGLRLSIGDASPLRPIVRGEGWAGVSGRGLRLVAELAADWGVEATDRGKTVWVELQPNDELTRDQKSASAQQL